MPTIRYAARLGKLGTVSRVLLSQVFLNIGIGTFGVLYNLYLATLGQSLAFIGTFNAVSLLAIGASSVPIGALTRGVGHRRMLSIGAVLLVLVQVVLCVSTAPTLLLAAGMLWGVAQAVSVVPVAPLLSESVAATHRATALGRLYAAWSLAGVVGSILGGVLPGILAASFSLGQANGTSAYRGALLTATLIASLGWPLLLLPAPEQAERYGRSQAGESRGSGWALRSVTRTAVAVMVTMALYSFACGLVAPFMNVYFAEQLREPTLVIGALFAAAALLGVAGSLLGPRLDRRLGSVLAVTAVRWAIVPCLFALTLGTLLPLLAMLGFVLRSALVSGAGALDSHFTLAAVPPPRRPLLSGLRIGTFNVFFALGAWGAGNLIPRLGYSTMFLWSAVVTTASCALFFGMFALPRGTQT